MDFQILQRVGDFSGLWTAINFYRPLFHEFKCVIHDIVTRRPILSHYLNFI
jgi:hypothetical protein